MSIDLKTSLTDLAEAEYAEAPASTIDIGRARADGRRRVLAARLAPVGGGVAVVAACALVVAGLGGTSPATPSEPAGGRQFTGTDPLTAVAKFGWLPEGFQTASHSSGTDYGDGVVARAEPARTPGPVTPPMLRLTSSASEPKLVGGQTKKAVTVAGSRQAYLVANPGDGPGIPAELSLHWQTGSGTWLTLGGLTTADQETTLLKVADSVTADGAAVPLPIHVEGLPTGVTLGEAMLNDPVTVGADGFNVGLSYHSRTSVPGSGHYFSISVMPAGRQSHSTSTDVVDPANPTKVKLTPANATAGACKDSEGLHICVLDDPKQPGPDPLDSIGGAQGLLDRITSLGTNPANWTTHVVS